MSRFFICLFIYTLLHRDVNSEISSYTVSLSRCVKSELVVTWSHSVPFGQGLTPAPGTRYISLFIQIDHNSQELKRKRNRLSYFTLLILSAYLQVFIGVSIKLKPWNCVNWEVYFCFARADVNLCMKYGTESNHISKMKTFSSSIALKPKNEAGDCSWQEVVVA